MPKYNINTLSEKTLIDELGLSNKIAKNIIRERKSGDFLHLNDFIKRVDGIGKKNIVEIAALIKFDDAEPAGGNRSDLYHEKDILIAYPDASHNQFRVFPPVYDDKFKKPRHDDLPTVDKKTWQRFCDMREDKSDGLTLLGMNQSVENMIFINPGPKGCKYEESRYYTYIMDKESRWEDYNTVYTIREITKPGPGAGGTAAGFGGTITIPIKFWEVIEDKIGIRYDYELRVKLIEDLYICSNVGIFTRVYQWCIGWGLVGTVDPSICSSRSLRMFDDVNAARLYRQSLGGLNEFGALGLYDVIH